MRLRPATDDDAVAMMAWFPDARSCHIWGGPQFRFPFTAGTFLDDSRVRRLPSYVLVDEADTLLAFGQYYLRAGRCHLGRLVVSPGHRRRGAGQRLVRELVTLGSTQLDVSECSLFVVPDNEPAIRLYEQLGFRPATYPEDDPRMAAFVYMTASAEACLVSPLYLVVSLWLRDGQQEAFEACERAAAAIIHRHGGAIERAVRPIPDATSHAPGDDVPFEVHVVRFPSQAAFDAYQDDPQTRALASARAACIARTLVLRAEEGPAYCPTSR